MNLIFLGPPGAGKGTLAQMLKDNFGIKHVSTGNIFRELIKRSTPLGVKIKEYVESGALVPDNIVIEVLAEEIKGIDLNKGFVLDGFPRTLEQAKALDKTLKEININIDKVVYFDASEDVVIERLSGRRTCSVCSVNYHIKNIPPKKEGICDLCGGKLYQRKDDEAGTVKNRLEVYKKQTKELIEYYRSAGLLETLNGDLSKDELYSVMQSKLALTSNRE